MDETILLPSPNWFQVSGFAVSTDGWLVYGGPSKSLCVIEPLTSTSELIVKANQNYQAHVVNWAHLEKIVSVDISPTWTVKKCVLAGSLDGSVKQWTIEKDPGTFRCTVKSTHTHEVHSHEKEEVVGVGYSSDAYAVTVGCFGNVVKWDLKSNVTKTFHSFLKLFKPTCMACSPHRSLNIAVGTKQGVVFVLDLNGEGSIVYKVRSQDDEVTNVSWCPQYEVTVSKKLAEPEKKFNIHDRIEKIRNAVENEQVEQTDKKDVQKNVLEESGIRKSLPQDSFDGSETTIVEEEDMFDMYKDHESNEFGHKKFEPKEIKVKVQLESEDEFDFLKECTKLKNDILKKNSKAEATIESLVEAIDNVHLEKNDDTAHKDSEDEKIKKESTVASIHIQKHLLATISKSGCIKIWSKSGKLVGSCLLISSNKNKGPKAPNWSNLYWHRPNCILIADMKSQLLKCNPLKMDCKNKLEWKLVHSLHKRGLYCITSNAPRVMSIPEMPLQTTNTPLQTNNTPLEKDYIWSVAQDRNVICYDLKTNGVISTLSTCGGFVYMVKQCPYDARKVAACVGDGAVRVWEMDLNDDEQNTLTAGSVTTYWQKVQGKVLSIQWHPHRENTIAFGTAEARVGIIEAGSKGDRPATVLTPALSGGVYSLCWRDDGGLYACAGGALVLYKTTKPDTEAEPVVVEIEGKTWPLSVVQWSAGSLAIGGVNGGVALMTPNSPHEILAVCYPFSKIIHSIEWHPLQTSTNSRESKYKSVMAVCSLDKQSNIALLEYTENEDGTKSLRQSGALAGHKSSVLQLAWNPHIDGLLMSTSQDGTVRVWEVENDTCVSIFAGHTGAALGCAWGAVPEAPRRALSAGSDCCLRLWDAADHPAHLYDDTKQNKIKKEKKKTKAAKQKQSRETKDNEDRDESDTDEQVAANNSSKAKGPKKFLIPITRRHLIPCKPQLIREMLKKHVKNMSETNGDAESENLVECETVGENVISIDCLKMFGSIKEINELLDQELEDHEDRGHLEAWITLSIFRGHIDAVMQFANKRDMLCPYLVSLAPCVSLKYWKDVTQMYVAQIDRIRAQGCEDKLYVVREYGGAMYRSCLARLAGSGPRDAFDALLSARLYPEAYLLCRLRFMESLAEEALQQWARAARLQGDKTLCALCHIALGDLAQAAAVLATSDDEECLMLAADCAKLSGQKTLASHLKEKSAKAKTSHANDVDCGSKELPTIKELVLRGSDVKAKDLSCEEDAIEDLDANNVQKC